MAKKAVYRWSGVYIDGDGKKHKLKDAITIDLTKISLEEGLKKALELKRRKD